MSYRSGGVGARSTYLLLPPAVTVVQTTAVLVLLLAYAKVSVELTSFGCSEFYPAHSC